MQKYTVIEEFCTELLYNPGVHGQETVDDLCLCAEIIQQDIGHSLSNKCTSTKIIIRLEIYCLSQK